MGRFFPFARHRPPSPVKIDTQRCRDCGKCVAACPNQVLGRVAILWHRHAVVRRHDACRACGACAKVCPQSAIAVRPPVLDGPGREGAWG